MKDVNLTIDISSKKQIGPLGSFIAGAVYGVAGVIIGLPVLVGGAALSGVAGFFSVAGLTGYATSGTAEGAAIVLGGIAGVAAAAGGGYGIVKGMRALNRFITKDVKFDRLWTAGGVAVGVAGLVVAGPSYEAPNLQNIQNQLPDMNMSSAAPKQNPLVQGLASVQPASLTFTTAASRTVKSAAAAPKTDVPAAVLKI